MEQRTPEWYAARCGQVTASRIADITAKIKSGASASRKNYLAQLLVERLTGLPAESYSNTAMEWGTEQEPLGRAAYELAGSVLVEECGYLPHPSITGTGASPDGLVGTDGLLEIKCPNTATAIEFILSASIPDRHQLQMQWQMACAGRLWCDYAVYDPRLPDYAQLTVQRVARDASRIADIAKEIQQFLAELDTLHTQFTRRYA